MGLIAVVIPGKNEEKTIRRCVQSVLDAGISSDDIYIVDDGSTDNMYEEARAPFEISTGGMTRTVVLEKNILRRDKNKACDEYGKHGKSESIRAAVQYFQLTERYRFIGPLDADTRVASNYYSQIITMFEDRKLERLPFSHRCLKWFVDARPIRYLCKYIDKGVGYSAQYWVKEELLRMLESGIFGLVIHFLIWMLPRFRETFESYTRMKKVAIVHGYVESVPRNGITAFRALEYIVNQWLYKQAQDDLGVILVAPGCASVWRSEVFSELDFAGDTLVEDMVWTIHTHMKRLGRVCYAPNAVVYTQDPDTIQGYIKQIDRWHVGFWQVMRKFRMPFHFRRVEVEMLVMILESVFFAGLYVAMPALVAYSLYEIYFFHYATEIVGFSSLILDLKLAPLSMACMDVLVMLFHSILCWLLCGRSDILKYCFLFPFLRYLNAGVYLFAFIKVIVLRRNPQFWFSPKRYSA